jgi:pimeloyl-ACP methyl ester carboxylesterase
VTISLANVRAVGAPLGEPALLALKFVRLGGLGDEVRRHSRRRIAGHGAITTLDDMVLSLFPILSPRLRVTAFDRPGHGASAHLGPTGSPWRQARAVREAALGLGLRRPVLLGHSYGTAVAMAHALQFPREIGGVVLLSPIAFPEIRLEHFLFAPRGLPGPWQIVNRLLCATLDPVLLPLPWSAMILPQAMPEA